MYLNLCVNAIKKLRDTVRLELPSPVKTQTTTRVAVTKTLSSGAVLVSTKSPAKQEKPALPATDQLTGEHADLFNNMLFTRYELACENNLSRLSRPAWPVLTRVSKLQPKILYCRQTPRP